MGERLETYLVWDQGEGLWAYGIYVGGYPARGGFERIKADALRSLRELAQEYGGGWVDGNGCLRTADDAS